jgi:two-component system CheB/CheR fusion protein
MARLMDDLLDVSRIPRGKIELRREVVHVADVVTHAVETARPLLEARRHRLEVLLPAEPLRLEADPTRLEQVLSNLLHNAGKYTEPGGRIWLSAGRVPAAERPGGAWIELRVRDNGMGISPELLPRVFDLFTQDERTLDRAQGGLGIGLTLVRKLIELQGGTVAAESEGPGCGSEFIVRLPALAEQRAVLAEADAPAETEAAVPSRALRVLIVEDDADAAQSLAQLLQMWGHRVRTALSGPTALELALEFQPDVALLDLGLPGMDGYEVARRLRDQPQTTATLLVALTGYGQPAERERSRSAGMHHHLVKPVDFAVLRSLLTRAAASSSHSMREAS